MWINRTSRLSERAGIGTTMDKITSINVKGLNQNRYRGRYQGLPRIEETIHEEYSGLNFYSGCE